MGRGESWRSAAHTACLLPILAGAFLWVGQHSPGTEIVRCAWAITLVAVGWGGALSLARGVPDSFAVGLVLAAGALSLRLVFWLSPSALSDDVYRYVWEGALTAEGRDPYRSAPDAPELRPYQERWAAVHARINHPEVPAVYPPLAQALHAGVVTLAGGAEHAERAQALLRGLYGLADLLVCWPLLVLLRRHRRRIACLSAWAWNPWVAQEFAGAAHLDALAVLCALGALACVVTGERVASARVRGGLVLLAAGAAIKLLPLALAPFLLRRLRRPLRGAVFFALCLVLAGLPFVLLTMSLPGASGLAEYAFRWESFNLVHRWIEAAFARHGTFDESWSDPRRLARACALVAWLALAIFAWRRRLGLVRCAGLLFGGALVLTPTLHPWYLAWSVPFLAFRPLLSFSALTLLSPLLYWPLARWRAERVWSEPRWLVPLVAGAFWGLLAVDLARSRRHRP